MATQPLGRELPVMLVHGYDALGDAGNDATQWLSLVESMRSWGWSGPFVPWAYYGCDANRDLHSVDAYGDHMMHGGGPDAHAGSSACIAGTHDRYTSIEHVAYHLAWAIHTRYNQAGQCVVAVAHSMGGLITRYALAQSGQNPEFPSFLCIKGVVTLGTPHGGHDFGCFTVQCSQMQPGSSLLLWLAQNAPAPQGLGSTKWIAIASEADWVVPVESALAVSTPHQVVYLERSGISHELLPNYMSAYWDTYAADDRTAWARYVAGSGWKISDRAAWPARWLDLALTRDAVDWAPEYQNPAPVAQRIAPAAAVTAPAGSRLTFEGQCGNPELDLASAEWWMDAGSGWTLLDSDAVQWSADPWQPRAFTWTFQTDARVRLRCIDAYGAASDADWSITLSGTLLAQNQAIAVPAEELYYHTFRVSGSAAMQYSFRVTDTSTLDVAFIRHQDLGTYQAGSSVPAWASHQAVQQAQDGATLSAGDYDLVFYCRNTFFDCDLEYSLSG